MDKAGKIVSGHLPTRKWYRLPTWHCRLLKNVEKVAQRTRSNKKKASTEWTNYSITVAVWFSSLQFYTVMGRRINCTLLLYGARTISFAVRNDISNTSGKSSKINVFHRHGEDPNTSDTVASWKWSEKASGNDIKSICKQTRKDLIYSHRAECERLSGAIMTLSST